MNIRNLIRQKKAGIAIIGMGYVGLPLAMAFASAGFKVVGIEQDKNKVRLINSGRNYIVDISNHELQRVVKRGGLKATNDHSVLKKADVIIICVPTPLGKNKQPDMSHVNNAVENIINYHKKDRLIILESTTYPGTTEEMILSKLENSGLKVGRDFYLVFSPERVDPGNKSFSVKNIAKLIGGVTKECGDLAGLLYRQIIPDVHIVSSPRTAEMAKLLENVFRNVNIALINELSVICRKMKIDIWEVIEAAKTKPFGFMPFYPGPGVGGHCIPLDPFYLSWKAKKYNLTARFIKLAGEINDKMPGQVAQLVRNSLKGAGKSVARSKVLILGVAYKKDIDDVRESPSLEIIRLLAARGADVQYHDPFVGQVKIGNVIYRSAVLNKAIINADCVVIATDHSVFNYKYIANHSRLLLDTRNATANIKNRSSKVIII